MVLKITYKLGIVPGSQWVLNTRFHLLWFLGCSPDFLAAHHGLGRVPGLLWLDRMLPLSPSSTWSLHDTIL